MLDVHTEGVKNECYFTEMQRLLWFGLKKKAFNRGEEMTVVGTESRRGEERIG